MLKKIPIIGAIALALSACQSAPKLQTVPKARTRTGVGNDTAADNSGIGQIDVSRSAIVELREHTDKMRAQVLYFQGKVMTDAQTINEANHEK